MGKKQKENKNSTPSLQHFEVFITGLPYETTEKQVVEFFDFAHEPKVKLPKYQDTGRCLGYGHVQFSTEQDFKKAIQKDGQHLGPRYINVRPAKGPKQVEVQDKNVPVGCKVLFLKNLPYDISKEALKEQFSSCGIIKEVRMIKNWQNKRFKGFVYIDYKDNGSVKKAIKKYQGKEFKGRKLFCDAVTTGMKKGYKPDREVNENEDNEQNIQQEQAIVQEQDNQDDE